MANCKEMDELTLKLLQLMDELVHCKVQLENATSEGFLYMAKTRMLLGKERVSMLQVPLNSEEEIPPKFTVSRECSGDDDFFLVENKFRTQLGVESKAGIAMSAISSQSEDLMKVKKRINEKNDEISCSDPKDENVLENVALKNMKKNIDPLNWFGVLVPQELRRAQNAFKKALSLSVDCANIHFRIEGLKKKLESANVNH